MTLPEFDIFLSYKSEDAEWVERLWRALDKRGARVWVDRNEIRPGDFFAEALERGLESSRSIGLVVTANSFESGWVREEYYRALTLSKSHQIRLIPILVENSALPGFLGTRQYVDFRNSGFEKNVDRIIWPGITGRTIGVIFHQHEYTWRSELATQRRDWRRGEEWAAASHLASTIERLSQTANCRESWRSPEPMLLKHQVEAAIRIGCRVVVISNPFWFWPWLDLHPESVEQCVQEILEVREKTRDTEDETVFVLHSHPDAFAKAPHNLPKDMLSRLSHFFHVPMRFLDEGKGASGLELKTLRDDWTVVWHKIQRELLGSERRNFGKFTW